MGEQKKYDTYEDVLKRIKKKAGYASTDISDVNDDYIKSFMADSQKYFDDAQGMYDAINWGNASTTYDERNASWQALAERANKVGAYYYRNRNKYKNYDDIASSIDEILSGGANQLTSFSNLKDYYSQWDSQEAYDTWKAEDDLYNSIRKNYDYANMVEKGKNAMLVPKVGIGGADLEGYNDYVNDRKRMEQYLNDDELGIYYYYLGSGKTKEAEDYFKKYSEVAKYRAAEGKAEKWNNTHLGELAMAFGSGVDSFVSGMKNLNAAVNTTLWGVETDVTTPTVSQYGYGIMSADNKGIDKVAVDAAQTIANQLPSMAVGGFIPGAGNVVMGMSAAGNAYTEMAQVEGVSKQQALNYGITIGVLEGVLQKAIGGISGLGSDGGFATNAIQKALPNITSALGRFALTTGANMVDEGFEEALQEVLDPIVQGIMTGTVSDDQDEIFEILSNASYSFLLGAVSAGTLEGIPSFANSVSTTRKANKQYSKISSDIVAEILEKNPNDSFALKMQGKLNEGKKLSGGNVAALVERGDRTAIESAIANKLTERGERGDISQLSQVLAKEAMGYSLSKAETRLIQSSDFGRSIQAELNPNNLSNQGEIDRWAEKIGTREVNPKQYNKQVEVKEIKEDGKVELESGKVIDAKSVSFNNEADEIIFKTATERVGRVDGWTNESANAMVKGYDGNVSALEYRQAYVSAFDMGKNGAEASQIVALANQTGIKGSTLLAAYDMGKQATEKALTNDTDNGKIKSEVKTDESTGLRLRDSSKWDGGKDSQKQVSGVEESTGRDTSREDTERKVADSEAVKLVNEGRKVKVSELGILNGSKTQTVTVVDKSQETSEMKRARKEAEKRGLKVIFFLGDNLVIEENGELISVRGYIKGEYVFVRADHPLYTSYQLMRHEIGHDMIAKGEVDINKVRAKLGETVGKENIDTVADMYALAYENSGLDADAIWEECICDSLGDMNVFSDFADINQGIITMVLGDIKRATEDTKTAPNKTRGAPEGKASGEIIDLTKDNNLALAIDGNTGATKYKKIAKYILDVLGNEKITLSDGKEAIVDKSDALHIANKAATKKTAQIARIKEIVQVAKLYAKAEDVIHPKFNSFYYYKANVRYEGETFPIFVNVGRASNDKSYHIYDITNKIRDTADRINGLERPKPNEGYALTNGISNKSISQNSDLSTQNSKIVEKTSRELDAAYLSAVERGDIETAQRFNEENEDIRYSRNLDIEGDSASEFAKPLSNRELLANALLDTVQHEVEYTKLMEYKSVIDNLEAKDIELAKLKNQIREATFGNGDKTKLKELKEKARKTEASINFYDKKLLQLESTQALKNVLERAKREAYSKALAKGRETLHANVEGRYKTAIRNQIKDNARKLAALLNKGSKEKNIKAEEQPIVRALLDITDRMFATDDELIIGGIETDTIPREDNAIATFKELYNEYHSYDDAITENKERRKELRSQMNEIKNEITELLYRERNRISKAKAATAFDVLISAYEGLQNEQNSYLSGAFEEDTLNYLKVLKNNVGDTVVQDMTLGQLNDLYKAVKMIKKMVTDSNKMFRDGQYEDLEKIVDPIFSELEKFKGDRPDLPNFAGKVVSKGEEFTWKNLRPVDVFKRIGSKTLDTLFWDVIKAQDTYAKNVEEIGKAITDARKKHGYNKWDVYETQTIGTIDGAFKVTLGEMMSIYAYSKREQASKHILEGGFTHEEDARYKDSKGKFKIFKTRREKAHPNRMNELMVAEVAKSLTAEQRAYVDELVNYITKYGEKGNEVSRILYGIDLFPEKVYFPLKSSRDFLSSTKTEIGRTQTTSSLANTGMTKPTTPGANNPIVLRQFDDVILEHLDTMSKYNAYVIPIKNLRKVYDWVDRDNDISFKTLLSSKHGKAASDVLMDYITDLNGGASAPKGFLAKLFSRSKAASVMAKNSVWVQQYFSIIRAMETVNPKYFIPYLGESYKNPNMKLYEEMKRYAPITTIKEMGGFDVGSNRGIADYIGLNETKFSIKKGDKILQDIFGFMPSAMDKLGWMTIWKAVKKEVAASNKYKLGSDEYLNACGKRMAEVVTLTQVYDSVNARSGFMRSKNALDQFATSFMGEPTVIVGRIYISAIELKRAVESGNKSEIEKATSTFVKVATTIAIANAMTSVAKSLIYAGFDDDDDETYGEKYVSALASAFADDINVFGYIPYARDISSILDGFTVDRPDMQLIEGLINAIEDMFDGNLSDVTLDEVVGLLGSFAFFATLPIKNIYKDIKGLANTVESIGRDYKDNLSKQAGVGLASGNWITKGISNIVKVDTKYSKSKRLYDAMVRGDEARIEYFASTYKTYELFESAVRKSLRYNDSRLEEAALAKLNNDSATYNELLQEVLNEGIFDREIVIDAFKAEYNYQKRKLEEEEN